MKASSPPAWLIKMDHDEKIRLMMTRAMNETVVTDSDKKKSKNRYYIDRFGCKQLGDDPYISKFKTIDWTEKAVRYMCRILNRADRLNDFAYAVLSGDPRSACIVTRNEKLPNGHGRANMFILRLFRFPWLRLTLSLRSAHTCRHKFEPYAKNACLNPYHYLVKDLPRQPIQSIVVDKEAEHGVPPNRPDAQWEDEQHAKLLLIGPDTGEKPVEDNKVDQLTGVPPNVTMQGDEIRIMYEEMAKAEGHVNIEQLLSSSYGDLTDPSFLRARISWKREEPREFDDEEMDEDDVQGEEGEDVDDDDDDDDDVEEEDEKKAATTTGAPPFHYQSGLSSPASDVAYSPRTFQIGAGGQPIALNAPKKEEEEEVEPMEHESAPPPFELNEPTVRSVYDYQQLFHHAPMPQGFFGSQPAAFPNFRMPFGTMTQARMPFSDDHTEPRQRAPDDVLDEVDRFDYEVLMAHADAEPGMEQHVQRPTYADGRPITPIEPRPVFRNSPSELAVLSANAKEREAIVRKGAFDCVEYREHPEWLTLFYHEEERQVGDQKKFELPQVLIDGYMSPEINHSGLSTRFSLGWINNPTRSVEVSHVRDIIGKGIRLYLLAGDLYIENLAEIPIFTQSICANMKNGFALNTVSKLPPCSTMKAFDLKVFSEKLAHAATKTYNDVYALSRMCAIRISFVKGWGEHYRRSTVLKSPVWLHLHLHNPAIWVDAVLTCMGAPPRLCGSRS